MTISEERLRVLEDTPTPEELKELVRGYRQAQLLKQQSGSYQRLPGCQCTWEEGDSPCPVHGLDEEGSGNVANPSRKRNKIIVKKCKPDDVIVAVDVPKSLQKALTVQAAQEGKTVNDVVVEALQRKVYYVEPENRPYSWGCLAAPESPTVPRAELRVVVRGKEKVVQKWKWKEIVWGYALPAGVSRLYMIRRDGEVLMRQERADHGGRFSFTMGSVQPFVVR